MIVAGHTEFGTTVTVPVNPAEITPKANASGLIIVPDLGQAQPKDHVQGLVPMLAGFVTLNPDWDGVLCCPGPITHWVHISAREIVSFQSFASMEIAFALWSDLSDQTHQWDETAFQSAMGETLSRPERLAGLLHAARLVETTAEQITGALIGAELAAARAYWLGQQIAVIGPDTATEFASALYGSALDAQGLPAMRVDEDRMAQAGLERLRRNIG
jgi:2-dehydro-3-deoxygalactonokinase